MECARARELFLAAESAEQRDLRAHLETCAACAAEAERLAWLDTVVRPALLVAPPTAAAARARRAALAAIGSPTPVAPGGRALSLLAYLLMGALILAAAGLPGAVAPRLLDAAFGGAGEPFRLAVSALGIWLGSLVAEPLRQWTTWTTLLLLAWGLREATIAQRVPAGGRSAQRSRVS